MPTKPMNCPECEASWDIEQTETGSYVRAVLVDVAPEIARHMREVHGNEETAIRMERWAVTAPPWEAPRPVG